MKLLKKPLIQLNVIINTYIFISELYCGGYKISGTSSLRKNEKTFKKIEKKFPNIREGDINEFKLGFSYIVEVLFRRLWRFLKKSWLVWIVILLNVIFFVLSNSLLNDAYNALFTFTNRSAFLDFKIWVSVVSIYMDLKDFISSMVNLFSISFIVVSFVGNFIYILLYLIYGIVGDLFIVLFDPNGTFALGGKSVHTGFTILVFVIGIYLAINQWQIFRSEEGRLSFRIDVDKLDTPFLEKDDIRYEFVVGILGFIISIGALIYNLVKYRGSYISIAYATGAGLAFGVIYYLVQSIRKTRPMFRNSLVADGFLSTSYQKNYEKWFDGFSDYQIELWNQKSINEHFETIEKIVGIKKTDGKSSSLAVDDSIINEEVLFSLYKLSQKDQTELLNYGDSKTWFDLYSVAMKIKQIETAHKFIDIAIILCNDDKLMEKLLCYKGLKLIDYADMHKKTNIEIYDKAMNESGKYLGKALASYPRSGLARNFTAEYFMFRDKFGSAISSLRFADKFDNHYNTKRNYSLLYDFFYKVLNIKSKNIIYYTIKTELMILQDNYIKNVKKTVKRNPNDLYNRKFLIKAHFLFGTKGSLKKELKKALQDFPGNTDLWYSYAVLMKQLKKKNEYKKALIKTQELAPINWSHKKKVGELIIKLEK